jgi:DNA-binding LacI/PurR family transcriptional regulator
MAAPRPTIADVARLAEVSIATVSRVLNRTVPVDAETAGRVRLAVAELNYIPHAAARTLASRRTDTIGMLLPEIGGEFFQPLLRGIELAASETGYDLLIHSTRMPRVEDAPHRPLGEHNTDGLLVFTESLDARELTRLHSIGFPLVLLHQTPPPPLDLPVVTIENRSGAQKLVEHLIDVHGCRRIVYLQGPEGHEDSLERETGYRRALKNRGLAFDPALVAVGEFDPARAHDAVEGLLAAGAEFDAIFTGDDDSAVGVIQALHQAGRRVPEQVAVAGFDDSSFARMLTPPLTTVRAPMEQVGQAAVRQLVRIIRGGQVEPRLVLPTELVIRRSCGCQT